jgi:hypothetical protein
MHILPSSKIPYTKLPLDLMISTKLTYMKKQDKRIKDGTNYDPRISQPVHDREKEASEIGLTLIDEFTFPHGIF